MKNISKKYPGFTFVELMFAIVVLGTMMAITMSMVVGMLRFYAFSNQIRQNQENGRNILDTMSRDIRFGQLIEPRSITPGSVVCVLTQTQQGNKAIKYYLSGSELRKATWDIADIRTLDCNNPVNANVITVNLPRMTVTNLNIIKTRGAQTVNNPNINAVLIKFGFLTGTPDGSGKTCDTKNIYCNKLEYNTVVNLRQGQ